MSKTPIEAILDRLEWTEIQRDDIPEGLYATHEGILDIEGFKLKCFILSDGQRVFDAADVERFFGQLK